MTPPPQKKKKMVGGGESFSLYLSRDIIQFVKKVLVWTMYIIYYRQNILKYNTISIVVNIYIYKYDYMC